MIAFLSQRLGSFLDESRAKIYPKKRQIIPLPSPINTGGFHVLSIKKYKAKVGKTSAFSPQFFFSYLGQSSPSFFITPSPPTPPPPTRQTF
jgi:hypothetical protein